MREIRILDPIVGFWGDTEGTLRLSMDFYPDGTAIRSITSSLLDTNASEPVTWERKTNGTYAVSSPERKTPELYALVKDQLILQGLQGIVLKRGR